MRRRLLTAVSAAAVLVAGVVVAARAGAGGPDATVTAEQAAAGGLAAPSGPAYPRTAAVLLEQDGLPSPVELARYDLVVIDSEWDDRLDPSWFAELRARNRDVVLLAYVNLVDVPEELGSPGYYPDRYSLWRFRGPSERTFPDQWLARTADGTGVSEWPGTTMANLTDTAPRVDGRTFADAAADWVVDVVWRGGRAAGGVWDGVFLDVWGDRVFTATEDAWDADRDGRDEPDAELYGPGNPWERGIEAAERRMRQRMPGAVLVANGERTLRGGRLDGRVWESFGDPAADRDPATDLRSYVETASTGDVRGAGVHLTIDRRAVDGADTEEERRRARAFLTATLLQDGYWAGMGADYGELGASDEVTGPAGEDYLGHPVVPGPTWEQLRAGFRGGIGRLADDLYRRDFDRGIVLHNAGDEERTVELEATYRHLDGTGPNTGEEVRTVTVGPRDGLVLLRAEP